MFPERSNLLPFRGMICQVYETLFRLRKNQTRVPVWSCSCPLPYKVMLGNVTAHLRTRRAANTQQPAAKDRTLADAMIKETMSTGALSAHSSRI